MRRKKIYFVFFVLGIGSGAFAKKYDDSWWKKIDPANATKWEILPQNASRDKKELILSKHTGFGDFGNFAPTPFKLVGNEYGSVEGFIQSLQFPENLNDPRISSGTKWPSKRQEVAALSGFSAFSIGKEAEKILTAQKITWVSFQGLKIDYRHRDSAAYAELIETTLRAKLDAYPKIKSLLHSTGDLKLLPDFHFDGTVPVAWRYWEMYMKLRKEMSNDPNKKLYTETWFDSFKKRHSLKPLNVK